MEPQVQAFFDTVTGTVSYVVHAGEGSACAVVDPVLDYDLRSGRTRTASADRIADFIAQHGLRVEWLLETHIHADHVSAASHLRQRLGGRIAAGRRVTQVQAVFRDLFHLGDSLRADGSQFDHLFEDGEAFGIGDLQARVIAMPGHTPACVSYAVGDCLFVGDVLFMPDVGTGRCDFPGGDARQLYRTIRKLYEMPPSTRVFTCHDYPPAGREPAWEATVAEHIRRNIHVHEGVTEEAFVAMRTARDATLDLPLLIVPSVQLNIRAGQMPPAEANGVAYLKVPINKL